MLLFSVREDLNVVCFLDLDLQQEETVMGLFSWDAENEGQQEILRRYQKAIKEEEGGVYFRNAWL